MSGNQSFAVRPLGRGRNPCEAIGHAAPCYARFPHLFDAICCQKEYPTRYCLQSAVALDDHAHVATAQDALTAVMQHTFRVEQLRRQQQQVSSSAEHNVVFVSHVRRTVFHSGLAAVHSCSAGTGRQCLLSASTWEISRATPQHMPCTTAARYR